MKIRKNHQRKHYRYSVNRKNLNKKHLSTGKIKDPLLKKLWIDRKRPNKNFSEMGLSSDPNKTVPIPNFKLERVKLTKLVNGFVEEEIDENELKKHRPRPRAYVAKELEEMSHEKAESKLRLPKGVVKHLSYFLDKYKFNYKAMVTDPRNHDQWTWKQFRMKIRKFMSIPQQFDVYLKKNGLEPGDKLNWPEYDSDSELK